MFVLYNKKINLSSEGWELVLKDQFFTPHFRWLLAKILFICLLGGTTLIKIHRMSLVYSKISI